MIENYNELRDKAMKWLRGKRNFNEGVAILSEARFKPGVVSNLMRRGEKGPHAMSRLVYHLRDFIQLWHEPALEEDTDLELGVVEGHNVATEQTSELPGIMSDETKAKLDKGKFPEDMKKLIRKFRRAYVKRNQLRRQMLELPENNDDETVVKRKQISDEINKLSDLMDQLYPKYEAFVDGGTEPEKKEEKPAVPDSGQEKVEKPLSELSKKELSKLKKSLRDKMTRAKNFLEYQSESPKDENNPIPEGDIRRVKYEAKAAAMRQKLEEVTAELASRT